MSRLPRDQAFDATFSALRDGYEFVSRKCRELGTDVFASRVLLQKFIFLRGERAARLFYDEDLFERETAAPRRLKSTLFGHGGVQGLDGAAHKVRKLLFTSLLTPKAVESLVRLLDTQWNQAVFRWQGMNEVVLFDEINEMICRAVCQWAGVPLPESDVKKRTEQLTSLIEGAGRVGPSHWKSRRSRAQAEAWIGAHIKRIRKTLGNTNPATPRTALEIIALFENDKGKPLEPRVAAVEMLNILRPTVAAGRFVVFAAQALHEHPAYIEILRRDDALLEPFVQEVRRFYPFFPMVVARTRKKFQWDGFTFPKGVRTLLDLYGTNHDERIWDEPYRFHPERFVNWKSSGYDLIPQGGGETARHHRCPGEQVVVEVMKSSVSHLCRTITYDVPRQDLRVDLTRMPTLPRSGFRLARVRALEVSGSASTVKAG